METSTTSWQTLSTEPLVLRREYSFGPGMANATVLGLGDRRLLLISPPNEREALEELREYGDVIAITETSGVHYMGLEDCRAVFPNANVFASDLAAERIAQKAHHPGKIEALGGLRRLVGDQLEILDVPGNMVGDVLLRGQTDRGLTWWIGDFVGNAPLPRNILLNLLFRLSGSGPGFRVNKLFFRFFVADKSAAKAFFLEQLEAHPLDYLIPAHGEPIGRDELGAELTTMFQAAVKG